MWWVPPSAAGRSSNGSPSPKAAGAVELGPPSSSCPDLQPRSRWVSGPGSQDADEAAVGVGGVVEPRDELGFGPCRRVGLWVG